MLGSAHREGAEDDAAYGSSGTTLVLFCGLSAAADTQNFDGSWLTTVPCDAARDALGYSYQFLSIFKNNSLHGLYGTEGEPSSLKIDGTIASDGRADATPSAGRARRNTYPAVDTPRGTQYSYNIEAHFVGATGSGRRIEGRPCTFSFTKQ
jgi:hypothetical protein